MKTRYFFPLMLAFTVPVYAQLEVDQVCNGVALIARGAAMSKNSGVSLTQVRANFHKYVNNLNYPQQLISFTNIIGDRMIKAVYVGDGYIDPDEAWNVAYTSCIDIATR